MPSRKACEACNYRKMEVKTLCRDCYNQVYYMNNRERIAKWQASHRKLAEESCKGEINGHFDGVGFVMVKNEGHPNARKDGYIYEHWLVMTKHLKRPLFKGEKVRHKNGIKTDNRLENLEIWVTQRACSMRVEDKIEETRKFLERYGYKTVKHI